MTLAVPATAPLLPDRARRLLEQLSLLLVLAAVLLAASVLAATYARVGNLVVLWPTNALAVAAMLRGPQDRAWRAGVLVAHAAVIAGLIATSAPLWAALWLGIGNAGEALAAFLALRRAGVGQPQRDPLRSTLLFLPLIGMVCAAAAVVCLPAALALGEEAPLSVLASFWWQDLFGMGMVVPFALTLNRASAAFLGKRREAALFAVNLAALGATGALAGSQASGSVWSAMVLPLQIFAAVRFGMLGTTSAMLTTAVSALSALVAFGAPATLGADVLRMEFRLALVFVALMAVASVIRQRDLYGAELQRRRVEAEAAVVEKSRLVRDLSHEMRTPLNAVCGFTDLLERDMAGPLSPQQRELLRTIGDAARQLHGLADDMIQIAGAEAGEVGLAIAEIDLQPQVCAAISALRPAIAAAGAEVLFEPPARPIRARADAYKVKDILSRLLANGVQHAGMCGPILVSLHGSAGGRVRIEVRDHGPGVAPGREAALFQPFNRIAKDEGRYGNKGVGLALARRLAELQGGSVGHRRPCGGGACFWLELPAA